MFKNRLIKQNKLEIEIVIVAIISMSIILGYVSLFKAIATILTVIVIWEVIRMLTTYAIENTKVMKIRVLIDGFIIFFLRDLVLIFSEEKYSFDEKTEKTIFILGIVLSLFIFRIMALKFSPNDKNCEKCPAIEGAKHENN